MPTQVGSGPGAYGAALKAEPFKRAFWTLSAWESPEASRPSPADDLR